MEADPLNVIAVATGAVTAFIFGAVIYHPKVLGTIWANGSGVDLTAKPSAIAFVAQVVAIIALALVVGLTATFQLLSAALLAILAAAAFVVANGLFQKKSGGALFTDGLYVVGAGALMIIAQGAL